MLQNYIDFLRSTIDKLTNFHFNGDVGSYFEAVGLGFLTLLLIVVGIVAVVAAVALPIVVLCLPWKLLTKKLVEQINANFLENPEETMRLYKIYNRRKKIYIGCVSILLLPFVVPLIMMIL